MILLTILNTLAILFLFYKNGNLYIEVRKDTTFYEGTLVAYHITLWKKTSDYSARGIYTLVIPLKNKTKTELEEEVNNMIAKCSPQAKRQKLGAIFSWLKTWEEVRKFEKNYSVVDSDFVEDLVSKFKPKK